MKKIVEVTEFDRAWIRKGLQRFMESYDMGVPKLHEHMMRQLDLLDADLDFKTLQRFLKGTRTDDLTVRKYEKFLNIVSPPPPNELMGDAIHKFFADMPAGKKERISAERETAASFAPLYRCYLRGEYANEEGKIGERVTKNHAWPKPERGVGDPAFEIPYSFVFTEPIKDTPYVRVKERVVNETLQRNYMDAIYMTTGNPDRWPEGKSEFEGVMTISERMPLYIAMLRQEPIHFPKVYLFHHVHEKETSNLSPLVGSCIALNENINSYNPTAAFEVKLYPVLEESGKE